MGTIGWSAINRPPPRKMVLILVGGQSVRGRPVRTSSSSCPDRVCPGLSPLPPPQGAGAVRGDTQRQTLPGHDELLVRTGRTLADCPPTRITTVFRGGGRLTADWAILPQNSLRLLNWAVSSWISIPNVNAYGGLPPPHTSRTRGCLPVANPGISSWNIQVQCSSSSHNESVASSTRRVPDRGFPPVQQYPPHPPTRNAPPGRPRDLHWITPIR